MKLEHVEKLLNRFSSKHVAVIGDLMLDRYIWGKASRISQEAPIPVVTVRDKTAVPGGSANVLRNIAALGANPVAFGLVGDDASGEELCTLLSTLSIGLDGVLRDPNRKTTEKARVIAGNQQVVRVDTEQCEPISSKLTQELLNRLQTAAASGRLDAIIIEDYAKGVVTESLGTQILTIAQKYALPVAIDPHPAHPLNLKGATVFTPNRSEAFALAGYYLTNGDGPITEDKDLLEVVRRLQELWMPECLLITLGSRGMALFRKDQPCLHVPTRAKEVFDVSGAGDTVIATYMLATLGGATPEEAAIFSNHAAGVVVGKIGTAPIYPDELLQSFKEDHE